MELKYDLECVLDIAFNDVDLQPLGTLKADGAYISLSSMGYSKFRRFAERLPLENPARCLLQP